MNNRRHAAIVAMYTSREEIGFIRDLTKARKKGPEVAVWWRIFGGREKENLPFKETPEKTALREIHEESGKELERDDLFMVSMVNKKDHDLYIFSAPVDTLDDIRPEPGKVGMEVSAFTPGYILAHPAEFHPDHIRYLEMAGLLIKKPVIKRPASIPAAISA